MNIYYKINEDIINNYDTKNRNYEIIDYLNKFQNYNIIEELYEIMYSLTITDKFNNLFNLYRKMNIDEINIIYQTRDNEVNLFGSDFAERYKNICKLTINGKEKELKDKYTFGWFSSKKIL